MIIAHLIYNTPSLRACSLTCYSWYIAAVLHLHHTLITSIYYTHLDRKFEWPKPLVRMSRLGLLPLIKKLHIHVTLSYNVGGFSPEKFNSHTLRQFSAFTNVQELGIDHLNIPKFVPRLRQCFGQFSPTVRSLALREPRGSHRQVIYFIGLFQHLENLKLVFNFCGVFDSYGEEESVDDLMLIPPYAPPLRGRLVMAYSRKVELVEDMIGLFGGIRFHSMDLFGVRGVRLLLDTCAATLETLRLHPTPPSEQLSLTGTQLVANHSTEAGSSRWDFDLSQSRSLRVLEFSVWSVVDDPGLYVRALSTVVSPVFSQVTIVYWDRDFCGVHSGWTDGQADMAEEASWYHRQFEAFHVIHKVRDFRLVLCADVWDYKREYAVWLLKQAVAAERTKGGFDEHFSEPLVVPSLRGSRPDLSQDSYASTPIPWVPL